MKKVGDMTLTSPQLPNVQEREFDGERVHRWRRGRRCRRARPLALNVSGLPHHSPCAATDRAGAGRRSCSAAVSGRRRGGRSPTANARAREAADGKREKLFNELVRLEQQRRAGSIDAARYAERRAGARRAARTRLSRPGRRGAARAPSA